MPYASFFLKEQTQELERQKIAIAKLDKNLAAAKTRNQQSEEEKAADESALKKAEETATELARHRDEACHAMKVVRAATEKACHSVWGPLPATEKSRVHLERLQNTPEMVKTLAKAAQATCDALFEPVQTSSSWDALTGSLQQGAQQVQTLKTEAARSGAQVALVMTKSHYLKISIDEIGEGLAADTRDEDIPRLKEEVKAAAYALAEHAALMEETKE